MRLFPNMRTLVIGGALAAGGAWGIGASAARAEQGEPVPAQLPAQQQEHLERGLAAQNAAAAERERAAKLEDLGGQEYKGGEVQAAQNKATIHELAADEYFARAGVPSCQGLAPATPPSPELKAAQERLDRLRADGGWAYKTGLVRRAELDIHNLKAEGQ